MKLRNAAPQWQSLPRDSYSPRYWEIDNKLNNSRKAFRNAFRIAIWLWILKRVSKEENTAKVRSDTRLSQKHVSVEMINAKFFWNAFTMCPRKKPRTLKQWTQVVGCVTIIIFISWSMINMLSNDTYLKFIQSCFTEQHSFQNWMSKAICATFRYM